VHLPDGVNRKVYLFPQAGNLHLKLRLRTYDVLLPDVRAAPLQGAPAPYDLAVRQATVIIADVSRVNTLQSLLQFGKVGLRDKDLDFAITESSMGVSPKQIVGINTLRLLGKSFGLLYQALFSFSTGCSSMQIQ
jgi:hypothetical protein